MAIDGSEQDATDAAASCGLSSAQSPDDVHPPHSSNGTAPHASAASHDEPEDNGEAGDEDDDDDADDDDEDEDEEETEPVLKYARLTNSLSSIYRNGASTSAVLNSGDKMIHGTHEGNVHVVSVPDLQPIRSYRPHQASITSISVSPFTAKYPIQKTKAKAQARPQTPSQNTTPRTLSSPTRSPHTPQSSRSVQSSQEHVYIASSSIDGHVCVSSLHDPKDVILRNFARPVQAVALSPDYTSDRMFVSGGLAGKLILTTGGKPGVRADANTNSAAAAASGWLGSMVGTSNGSDRELHAGEGAIHAISWSLSGKYVAWVNETGIMIMRSSLHLDRGDSDLAWERFAFIEPPKRQAWKDMTGVWKPRMQWVDDRYLDSEDQPEHSAEQTGYTARSPSKRPGTSASQSTASMRTGGDVSRNIVEQLLVGWGDAIWVIEVRPGVVGATGPGARNRSLGQVSSPHWLTISDGIVSSLTLLTRRFLLAVIYRTKDDADQSTQAETSRKNGERSRKGIRRRQNALPPDLRIIDLSVSPEQEIDIESLSSIQKYETLSAADYFLSTIYMPAIQTSTAAQKGALNALGGGFWDVSVDAGIRAMQAGRQATRLFSSGASVLSRTSGGDDRSSIASNQDTAVTVTPRLKLANPALATPGLKVFFHSPYDCVLAVKRENTDRLQWLLERKDYSTAWHLLQANPEAVGYLGEDDESRPSTPSQNSLAEFLEDSSSSSGTISGGRPNFVAADREKQRIGDLWVEQLVAQGHWQEAAETARKVLGDSKRWEHWVWVFAEAQKFDEITPQIPTAGLKLSSSMFEVVLAHYLQCDLRQFEQLIETWNPALYDTSSIIKAVNAKLKSMSENGAEGARQLLLNTLARLYLENQQPGEALNCFLQSKNAERTLDLIKQYQLLANVNDKVWPFVTVGVPDVSKANDSLSLEEKGDLSAGPVRLLAQGALQNLVSVESVVHQLQSQQPESVPYLYFYFRALWNGEIHLSADQDTVLPTKTLASRQSRFGRKNITNTAAASTRMMLLPYATLAVSLFAEFSRPLLTDLLRSSDDSGLPLTEVPGFYEHASAECEKRGYTQELVHLLSATGQMRQALHLIIDKIGDVKQAVEYARDVDDEGLWEDLLSYSMDKPVFVRGLLLQGGSVSDTFSSEDLVRRIPNGLEIPGLREGLTSVLKDAEVQASIAEGAARVCRTEVAIRMDELFGRRDRGFVFDLQPSPSDQSAAERGNGPRSLKSKASTETIKQPQPQPQTQAPLTTLEPKGCAICEEALQDIEAAEEEEEAATEEPLLAYQCGHVSHLNCILDKIATPENVEAVERLQRYFADQDYVDRSDNRGRSTTEKIARAQRIAEVLGNRGCTLCDGEEDEDIPQEPGP